MRTRCVPVLAFLGLAALLGGCSDGQFVFFPHMEPGTPAATRPIRQSSGDGAGMTAFSSRTTDLPEDDQAEAPATNAADASVMR